MLQLHDLGVRVDGPSLELALEKRNFLLELGDLELGCMQVFLQLGRRAIKV